MGIIITNVNPELRYSPLIANGIPDLKEGSADYDDYWEQVRDWCLNGYKPARGSWIPPNLFWYLNIWKINRKRHWFDKGGRGNKIDSFPIYRDVEAEIIMKSLYERRQEKKGGLIFGKRRRVGITEDLISHLYWEAAMFPSSQVFAATPNQKALTNIRGKFNTGHRNIPPAFFQNLIINNKEETKFGIKEISAEGEREMGTLSNILWKVFTNSGVLKGAWASFGLFDEIGEYGDNPSLLDSFMETIDCFKEGDDYVGMPVLAGTTDTKNSKNIHFMQMWNNCEKFDLEKVFIPADYVFGDKYFDMSTGVSDRVAARKEIESKKEVYDKMRDKTALLKYRQNNPLSEDDMFLVNGNSAINMQRVNQQIKKCSEEMDAKYFGERGNLMWVKTAAGFSTKTSWGVIWMKNPMGRWYKTHEPINKEYADADIMGIDDFMKDTSPFSESLGGICVYRRLVHNSNIVSKIPVCTYLFRPSTLREFHEDCLLTAVYYGCKAAVEYINEQCKEFFLNTDKVNGRLYMKTYPRVMGKVVNERDAFGYHVGATEKDIIISRISEWVDSPAIENCYDRQFLEQIGQIGDENSDLGSAFGICLLYEADLTAAPVKSVDEIAKVQRVAAPFSMGDNGVPVSNRYNQKNTFAMRQRHKKLSWMNLNS